MADLTEFCKGGDVYVISDLEGAEIPKDMKGKKLIICGDLLDSTQSMNDKNKVGNTEFTSFNKQTGIIGNVNKSCNIQNMIYVINNTDTCRLILGNRDVNKIKTGPMTMMKSDTDLGKKFNGGDVSYENYSVYLNAFKAGTLSWNAESKDWAPFWNLYDANGKLKKDNAEGKLKNETEKSKKEQLQKTYDGLKAAVDYWKKSDTDLNMEHNFNRFGSNYTHNFKDHPFLLRFYRIFGFDPEEGGMTARNLLYAIAIELGIKIDIKEVGLNDLNTSKNDNNYTDKLAFFVLAVFRTMNLEQGKHNQQPFKIINKETRLKNTFLKGLLRRFYKSSNVSFYAIATHKINNVDYTLRFSHGGITKQLLTKFNDNYAAMKQKIEKNTNAINTLTDLTGGSTDINGEFIKLLQNILLSDYNALTQPSPDMLLLFALSAPFSIENNMFVLNSPINPGINTLLNNLPENNNEVQIFGHIPIGFSTTLYKPVKEKNIYLINLDNSVSYKYSGFAGDTSNYVKLIKDNIEINSIIDFSKLITNTKTDFLADSYKYIPFRKETNKIVKIEMKLTDYFDITEEITQKIKDNVQINKDDKNITSDIRYHGSNKEYHVFVVLNGVAKQLVLYSRTDKPVAAAASAKPPKSPKSNYEQKYLKYKQKYLQLAAYARANNLI